MVREERAGKSEDCGHGVGQGRILGEMSKEMCNISQWKNIEIIYEKKPR